MTNYNFSIEKIDNGFILSILDKNGTPTASIFFKTLEEIAQEIIDQTNRQFERELTNLSYKREKEQ